jgi:hypothetical protein
MHFLPILIPILALCIPLAAVVGRMVIQPLVEAIARLAEVQRGAGAGGAALPQERLAQLEARLEGIEKSLGRLEEESEFRRLLERKEAESLSPRSGDDRPAV